VLKWSDLIGQILVFKVSVYLFSNEGVRGRLITFYFVDNQAAIL
jgi:hypothetical protein